MMLINLLLNRVSYERYVDLFRHFTMNDTDLLFLNRVFSNRRYNKSDLFKRLLAPYIFYSFFFSFIHHRE